MALKSEKMNREKIEEIVAVVITVLSVFISLLDLLGLLDSIPFLATRLPAMTLLVVGLISGYLVLERKSKLDRIESEITNGTSRIMRSLIDSTGHVIRSLDGVEVRGFHSSREMYDYVIDRMLHSRSKIDDLTWGESTEERTVNDQEGYDKYIETLLFTCEKGVHYREIFSFPAYIDRAQDMIDANCYNYHARYYTFPKRGAPPRLTFMIVDSDEVIVADYRGRNLPEKSVRLAIKHPQIVALFEDYYNTIWTSAVVLKEGGKLDDAKRQILKADLERRMMG